MEKRSPRVDAYIEKAPEFARPIMERLRSVFHQVVPDIEENIEYYTPRHLEALKVKPGITGLAQVEGRGHLTFQQINEYDIRYVENQSLWLDLKILIRTLFSLVRRDGAV